MAGPPKRGQAALTLVTRKRLQPPLLGFLLRGDALLDQFAQDLLGQAVLDAGPDRVAAD